MNIIIKNVPLETLELHPKLTGIKSSINHKQFQKFLPSIRIYGIIEPLKVVRENNNYFIVDGFVRYQTLLTNNLEIHYLETPASNAPILRLPSLHITYLI
jgi:ParB-like chromosome segregation protein Spo0J